EPPRRPRLGPGADLRTHRYRDRQFRERPVTLHGIATANFVNAPSRFVSKSTRWAFNVDRANQLLDGAGWKRGSDGIRAKAGKKLRLVYQTSINALRQKTQQVVKQACAKAGIDVELKSVTAN